ncbi:multidrug ABC transporter ATP-binding protein [Cellulomonas marina]|uniref:Fatty acid ABC transporter ATP-binding/permease protein n=2 Tax=Cellulomonas marina TaxID=988821 RepID=A0A1I0ZQX4_9CELL|nr:multidrug ABC transporter ATP-binding protein [Cellulomonas marina]SFB28124.1 ATP-binding cassette, subfamily B [Cellulomonas marina]
MTAPTRTRPGSPAPGGPAAGGPPPGGPARGPMGGPMGGRPGGMMGVPVAKAMDFRGSLRRLVGMLRPERAVLLVVLALTAVSVTLSVLGPRILGHATDVVFEGVVGRRLGEVFPAGTTKAQALAALEARGDTAQADLLRPMDVVPGQGIDFDRLGQVLLVVLGLYLAASLLGYLQGVLTTQLVQRTVFRMRRDVQAKLGRLPLSYVDRHQRGEILSRVTNDIDNVAQTMQQTLSQLITSLLTIVGVLAMMVWISPLLAVVALVTVPLSAWVTVLIAKRSQPQFVAQWASTGKVNAHVEEMFTGHTLVKVFGRQEAVAATFRAENERLYEASFRAQFISGAIQPAMMFISNIGYVVIAVVGALQVAGGAMTLGSVQAFIQYSRQFTQPVTQVASMANILQSGVASAERVFELLDEPEQRPDPVPPAAVAQPVRGRVAFEDVSFRYVADTPLIEHLDLVAEPGQTVAIVGPTGAGKTTLVNLLMRFYEVDGGRITLDGVDTAAMRRADLRSQVGMVLQDTWLFGGTIAENIAYGTGADAGPGGRDRERMLAAARATYVDRFVHALPDGYETVIDEEGGNVSAGEKQLITIARAFLADPALLVLDEATSSVDTRTEVLVQGAMNALRQGRTSFVIAHRLSTIRDADVILVMEHGAIVEQGSHAALLAADGAYARLYRSQFAAATAADGV